MITIVIPTIGRPSLTTLLDTLAPQRARSDAVVDVIVVDDRRDQREPLPVPPWTTVLAGRGAGPAAARNTGWRKARHPWIAFLDDDVEPEPGWLAQLVADLQVTADVGASQGNIRVPLPADRRPTDWERVTAGLADGQWITADMAYRFDALVAVDGFDERFPGAYREDAELAHRVRQAGWRLVRGRRSVRHPVRPESAWISVRTQRGNADDALLRRLYGAGWRSELGLPRGRRGRHALITAAAVAALVPGRHRRAAAALWLAGTAEFAWARIAPGPRSGREIATMLVTSALIPPVAIGHWCRGWWRSEARRGERR
jgi:glycosyltransferase involved in cell wall biosynthesis